MPRFFLPACPPGHALLLLTFLSLLLGMPLRVLAAGPIEPRDALAQFVAQPGVRVELAACEPLVIDPVAVAFDPQGRMWVVEMRDYPYGPAAGETSLSRLQILEDRDGDGFYEHGWTFAEGLPLPTGLQLWRNGAIVTLAGRVVYLADDDGDLRADRQETWFTGFEEQNSQLRANHPHLAADGMIYVANGLRGGSVVDARRENAPAVSISGSDFRFDPRGTRYEAVAGMGQFGLTFDDAGNRFVCSNREPLMHAVLQNEHLARNPRLAVPRVLHEVAASGEDSRVYALTEAWTTSTLHAGQFTAACGTLIYRGDALPELYGAAFVCEPTGSLVHGEKLSPQGATFKSQPLREKEEFLASRDAWFRPVNLATGPDGALVVVDMYRAVIEHPDWMPEELRTRRDLLDGNERGRIYRVTQANKELAPSHSLPPDDKDIEQLVALLTHANVWQRETAFRLLLEQQPAGAVEAVREVSRDKKAFPAGRALTLSLLSAWGELTAEDLIIALADAEPLAQVTGLQLAEPLLGDGDTAARLFPRLVELGNSTDPQVRFHTALALGEVPTSEEVIATLVTIAARGADDPWTRAAILSSCADQELALLTQLLGELVETPAVGSQTLVAEVATLIGTEGDANSIQTACNLLVARPEWEAFAQPLLTGLCRGAGRRAGGPRELLASLAAADPALDEFVHRALATALVHAQDSSRPEAERLAALELLRHADFASVGEPLIQLAGDLDQSTPLRQAAIQAVAGGGETAAVARLLESYSGFTPAVRQTILAAILDRPTWTASLLDAVAAGDFTGTLDPATTGQLRKHRDPQLRARAEELFPPATADRSAVLAQYAEVLDLSADPLRGRELFAQQCATCHRIAGIGTDVGPDIADSRVKAPAQLLVDILDPNRAIDSNYVSYTAITTDGRVQRGILLTETAASLTLKQAENQTVALLREDIEQIESDGVSLMPEGFEKQLPPQAMADLISFIKNWRYLDGAVPLAEPVEVP